MTCGHGRQLAPLVRPLPAAHRYADHDWTFFGLNDGLTLFVATAPVDPPAVFTAADPPTESRSTAGAHRAMLKAMRGHVGIDIETLPRVALNADATDAWLARDEQRSIAQAADPVFELACHWMLKEAYGKALRLGLALPLDQLSFRGEHGEIVLDEEAPLRSRRAWKFALYERAALLLAVAHHYPDYT